MDELQRWGTVVAISFVEPSRLNQYLAGRTWTMRVLADPQRAAYQAFGLERASWRELLRPRAMPAYLKLILRGKMPQRPQEDVHQLGGDFILDPAGHVVFSYRSKDPADRPIPSQLLAELERVAQSSGHQST